MKLHTALLSCILLVATFVFAQSSQPTQTSLGNAACPQPKPGKIAWFDTCSYLPLGNGVKPGHPLSMPDPQYCDSARQAKITGQVQLAIAVNATGLVDAVRVVKPLEPGLDQNAVQAVSTWRFTPGTRDGKPVPVQFEVEVGYRLY